MADPGARQQSFSTARRIGMKKTSLTQKESLVKRVQYHRYGGPEVLRVGEFALAAPGRGQIRVRVRAVLYETFAGTKSLS
jgi:hypothetical protein